LFPLPGEISLHCSCPDWAVMCKHVAAVLYGVGARLDEKPELLFLLRGVDHEELISADAGMAALSNAGQGDGRLHIAESDLSHLFGIEMTEGEADAVRELAPKRPASVAKARKVPSKNPTTKGKPSGKRITVPKNEDKSFATKALDRGFSQRPPKKNRAGTKKAVPDVPKTLPLTGDAVVKLRKKLNMTKAQLARILDVSPVTIGNWEKSEGPLKLRARTRKAWDAVSKLKNKS
jgi:uncharacterized Zn finger protein